MYEISGEESDRINILRTYFSILVVFIHMYNSEISTTGNTFFDSIEYVISKAVAGCAVPGFFVISSVLLYKNDFIWTSNILKKIKRLVVPYFLLNTFWVIFYAVAQASALKCYFNNNIIADWSLFDWVNAYLGIADDLDILLYPLWFLKDLFILNVFSKIIKQIMDKFFWIGFSVTFLLYLFDVNLIIIKGSALFFFVAGYFIVKLNIHFQDFGNKRFFQNVKNMRLSVAPAKCIIILLYLVLIILDLFSKEMTINTYVHKLCAIIGVLFFAVIATNIRSAGIKKIMLFISKYSMGIYLFHEMNLSIVRKIILKLLPQTSVIVILEYFFISFIIICGCLMLCVLGEKYFTKIYCIITGAG